jgi:centrosomal protein CEP41
MEVRRMRPKPKISAMEKKIIPNPRYSKVETVVDTGNNLRKELERLDEVHQLYKFRNDEVFRRVNINNLVRLVVEQTKLEYQLSPGLQGMTIEQELNRNHDDTASEFNDSATDELDFDVNDEIVNTDPDDAEDIRSVIHRNYSGTARQSKAGSRQGTARSVTSVAMGVGEMDKEDVIGKKEDRKLSRPFLLLDVREPDDYLRSHLVYSNTYQHIRLNRAFDYETREMLRLKNRPGAIIVLYDDDESLASRCATTLTQRGYDNVFMLSGGIRVAKMKYPESLVVSGEPSTARLEEGEVLVLERMLEDNIRTGESRSSRAGTVRSSRFGRSSSVGSRTDLSSRRWGQGEQPIRTSTALARRFR